MTAFDFWWTWVVVVALLIVGACLALWRWGQGQTLRCARCGQRVPIGELHRCPRPHARRKGASAVQLQTRRLPALAIGASVWLAFGAWAVWEAKREARTERAVVAGRMP